MRLLDIQYLPHPAYFALLWQYPDIQLDRHENFVKQTYRNRCRILTANGTDTLTIPVQHTGHKIPMHEVRIDYRQKWLQRHWRAIASAYGKAPFFEYYADELQRIFYSQPVFLIDLTTALLTQCLDFLDFDRPLHFTDTYYDLREEPANDWRSLIHPKTNPAYSKTYKQVPYQQVFGSIFVDNLSVLDLIFCTGPQAGALIKAGIRA